MTPPESSESSDFEPSAADASDAPDALLDRLVDDELDDRERRALLLSLERAPDGWRRCALAFLEAQAWGQSFQSIVRETGPDAGGEVVSDQPAPRALRKASNTTSAGPDRAGRFRQGVRYLSLAASFLLAFALGMTLKDNLPSIRQAQAPPSPGSAPSTLAEAPVPDPSAPAPMAAQHPRWGTVRIVADRDGDGQAEEFHVPAIDAPEADIPHWLTMSAQTLPADLLREFQRRGYRVESHHRLLPIPLEDGRRMYTPVQDVRLKYVGNEYQ